MVFSETIHVMLLTHDKWRQFTGKRIVDAHAEAQVLLCLSAESRDAVSGLVDKAVGGPHARAGLRLHVRPQLRGPGRAHLGGDVDGSERVAAVRLSE
jgi:hypothetical protein